MKICIINNLYPPHARGGAGQVVAKTVEGLERAGHEVVVVTTAPEGGWCERDGKRTTYRYRPRSIFFYTEAYKHSFLSRFFWHLIDMFHIGSARFVWRILQEEHPDIVHTHNLMGLGFLIPLVVRSLGIRHVHTVHDVQLVEPSGIILKQKERNFRYDGMPTRVYSWMMRFLMGSPEVMISPSQFLLDFYTDRGFFRESKKVLLRNPITFDIAAHAPRPDEHMFRFLYLGQVEEHKGVELLIDAFKGLASGRNVQLHIVGSGSLLRAMQKNAKGHSRIHIYGRMRRVDLPALFRKMNMVVVPSLCYENSPTVIFESFAFGLPVLASDIEGIAELIREGENGMTFEAGSIVSLQKKMAWCLSHPQGIAEMGGKTARSLDGLSLETYIRTLESLYRKK